MLALASVLAAVLMIPAAASASTTYVVTGPGDTMGGTCDSGVSCSLRQAFAAAVTAGGSSTIQLTGTDTYTLTQGELDNTGASTSIDIQGNGAEIALQGIPPGVYHLTLGTTMIAFTVFKALPTRKILADHRSARAEFLGVTGFGRPLGPFCGALIGCLHVINPS